MGEKADPESEQERLLRQLAGSDRAARIAAIEALSQVGDETALEAMRDRLRVVGREHQALIIAIGTLRWRLSGEAYSSLDHHG
jgi:hypothetical protein